MSENKKRKGKLLRIAALGALVAWVVQKRRSNAEPEGEWKDLLAGDPQEPTGR